MINDRGGVTVDGVAHLSLTEAAKLAIMTVIGARPDIVAFETYIVDEPVPTIYMNKAKARVIAEYTLKIT
jgi:hypothetical protein